MIIVIGLCTCQRPTMLANTLESLVYLNLPDGIEVILIVVDNDIDRSGETIFKEYEKSLKMKACYYIEEKRGIAYARNNALCNADKYDADLMLFIDDDEIVNKDWLNAHLTYYQQHQVDVISGPVYSSYPKGAPIWIRKGGFFDPQRSLPEHSLMTAAATGNVMFNFKKLYHQFGLRFDEQLKSREDNDFFMAAYIKGAIIHWTNTAIVHETVPLSKMNTTWLLQRVYKGGEAFTKREIKYQGKVKGRLIVISRVPYYCFRGLMILPLSLIKGYAYLVKSLQQFSIAMGMIGGLIGTNHDDYQVIHGY